MADHPDDSYEFKLFGRRTDGALAGICQKSGKFGVVVPIHDGQSLSPGTEVVRGERIDESTLKITTLYKTKGPGQVATPRYRSNYDAVFKSKSKSKSLNNDWN